jgi:hypothetical protein
MREPDQTATWPLRGLGAPVTLVAVQAFVVGLYRPPEFVVAPHTKPEHPPQTIISVPVQMAVWFARALGAFVVLRARHRSCPGRYRAPVLKKVEPLVPPHTIIWLPAHTAVWSYRGDIGKAAVGVQVLATGSYRAPFA